MAITFDPANLRIILDTTYVEAIDLYSRWKEWVQEADNAKWLPAFSTVGGEPLGGGRFVSQYFFLLNGWRIRPQEADQTLVIAGNISVLGGGDPVVPTLGSFKVLVQYTVPVQAQAIATDGGGGATPAEIAAAVRGELAAELAKLDEMTYTVANRVDVNVKSIADKPLKTWNGTAWV
jgi:hypothetical protein